MTKKKTSTKSEAGKVEKKETSKSKEVKSTEKTSVEAKSAAQEDVKDTSGTKGSIEHVVSEIDAKNNPDLTVGEVVEIPVDEAEELQKEFEADNKKQFNKIQKLSAVAFNGFRDTTFNKLDKKVKLSDLSDPKKLPNGVNIHSEVLLSNGQIWTMKDGLTVKFNKEALKSLK